VSEARDLLDLGFAGLESEMGEPFTVQGFADPFIGLCDEEQHSNTLGEGGFLPEAAATLYVARSYFDSIYLKPWIGMRLTLKDREFLVKEVGQNQHLWRLVLEQAFPKVSEVPCFISVLAADNGSPLLYSAGLLEPD
jgi:hypothetical protein